MAKLHTIRRRIKSVASIHQITKAMELVAASKLRRAQEATLRSRMYAVSMWEALRSLRAAPAHPLFAERPVTHHTIVLFSSDRGLAGAYNTNLFKSMLALVADTPASAVDAIVIGQKGAQFLNRLTDRLTIAAVYANWPQQPTAADIRPIAHQVTERFVQHQTDRVTLIYTDFRSLAQQKVIQKTLLPLTTATAAAGATIPDDELLFEPSPADVLASILPRIIEVQLYQASLEAAASEQSMRMLAMKNASDNADDLTADLTLTYNGVRQGAITQQLAEIISGAEVIS